MTVALFRSLYRTFPRQARPSVLWGVSRDRPDLAPRISEVPPCNGGKVAVQRPHDEQSYEILDADAITYSFKLEFDRNMEIGKFLSR